jgi:hypothetical protein
VGREPATNANWHLKQPGVYTSALVAKTAEEIHHELDRTGGGPVYFEDPQSQVRYVALRRETFECLLPTPEVEKSAQPSEWSEEKNARRFELIHKKFDLGLTAEETGELALRQAQMLQYRNRVAPLPLDDAPKLLGELLAKDKRTSRTVAKSAAGR